MDNSTAARWVRISGPIEALTQALVLSATALDDKRSQMALNLANTIAAGMTPAQIRSAKQGAQIRLCADRCADCDKAINPLETFPKQRCVDCHAKAPEVVAQTSAMTADRLSRMWGGAK